MDARVKMFLSSAIVLDTESQSRLEHVLSLDDVQAVIILPDVHAKPDNPFPT